jgi:hypothetical protein
MKQVREERAWEARSGEGQPTASRRWLADGPGADADGKDLTPFMITGSESEAGVGTGHFKAIYAIYRMRNAIKEWVTFYTTHKAAIPDHENISIDRKHIARYYIYGGSMCGYADIDQNRFFSNSGTN